VDCCNAICGTDIFCCAADWDESCAGLAPFLCDVCGPAPAGSPLPLGWNWNGLVHAGEAGSPDAATGYRSIADRGLRSGTANSLGGASGTVDALLSYTLVGGGGALDTVFIGGPRDAGNGVLGFDTAVDGDSVGIAPTWDPTLGTGELLSATTAVAPAVVITEDFALGLLFNASVGGGTFDVTLGFKSGLDVTATLGVPDWFADFDGLAPAPGDGAAFQGNLTGPLSGGDGFEGTEATDSANAGAPLNVIEGLITYGSLLDLGAAILGEELTSITFSNASGGNPNMTVGIYAASIVTGAACPADVDGSGVIDVNDLVAVILAWGPCPPECPEDVDGNGAVDVNDLVAVILGWGPCA
jgi:hypothetical protein